MEQEYLKDKDFVFLYQAYLLHICNKTGIMSYKEFLENRKK